MSFFDNDLILTDAEKDANLLGILRFSEDDKLNSIIINDENTHTFLPVEKILIDMIETPSLLDIQYIKKIIKEFSCKLNNISELLSYKFVILAIKSPEQRKKKVFWHTHKQKLDIALRLYAKKENLSTAFLNFAKEPDCLTHLTGYFLNNYEIPFNSAFHSQITELSEQWHTNKLDETAYIRTSYFQKFIHEIYNLANVFETHHSLDSSVMRIILSTARLHFSYYDIKYLSLEKLFKVHKNSHNEVKYELENEAIKLQTEKNSLQFENQKKNIPSMHSCGDKLAVPVVSRSVTGNNRKSFPYLTSVAPFRPMRRYKSNLPDPVIFQDSTGKKKKYINKWRVRHLTPALLDITPKKMEHSSIIHINVSDKYLNLYLLLEMAGINTSKIKRSK